MTMLPLRVVPFLLASFVLWNCNDDSTIVAPRFEGDAGAAPALPGSRSYDAEAYTLRGRFDWNTRRLIAEEEISLKLTKDNESIVTLDAAVDVKGVTAGGNDLKWTYDANQRLLHVDLASVRAGAAPVTFVVNYEAALSNSLSASRGRDDDPVGSRVVFTSSEPDRGLTWLVANHHPSDRARWAVEMTVAQDEDLIANGKRVHDEVKDGSRVVSYEITQPLPTYLMAFAAGQIEHRDRTTWTKPLSIWYRRGFVFDAEAHLDMLVELMTTFEKLVGPYPFDSYGVVLLPEFGGGMENATVTFNTELSGQSNGFSLNAHELAHHWFGDWVTMLNYEDVWFKEGMATLLAAEAERARRDVGETKGRLFGSAFPFAPDDAVVDKSLKSISKYTSGPYDRAAWMITQIRAKIGEDAFWKSLRDMLEAHKLDSVDGETFVRSFAPALDEASIRKVLDTLEKKPPPQVTIDTAGDGGTTGAVTLSLADPSAALLEPIKVVVIDAAGAEVAHQLVAGTPLTVTVPAGGYLAYDEKDTHPSWDDVFADSTSYEEKLLPRMVPSAAPAVTALQTRSVVHQERLLAARKLPTFGADKLAAFYAALDSEDARRGAEIAACQKMRELSEGGGDPVPWANALKPILKQPAISLYGTGYANCGTALPKELFASELRKAVDASSITRVSYLLGFDYGAEQSLDLGARVATQAPVIALRDQAISRLAEQVREPSIGYTKVLPAEIPAWKEFFRARLAESTSSGRFRTVWRGVNGLSDDGALVTAAQKLHGIVLSAAVQRQVVCDANRIAAARPAAWEEFRNAAKPWETLAPGAAAALQDPAKCAPPAVRNARVRPLPARLDAPAIHAAESAR